MQPMRIASDTWADGGSAAAKALRTLDAVTRGPKLTAALVAVASLLCLSYVPQLLEPPAANLCLVNLANNPRTASLFSRGVLERHGSGFSFDVVTPSQGCDPRSLRILLVTHPQLMDWCLGPDICILTGDETCRAPGPGLASLHEYLLHAHLFPVVPDTAALGELHGLPTLAEEDNDDNFDSVLDEAADDMTVVGADGQPFVLRDPAAVVVADVDDAKAASSDGDVGGDEGDGGEKSVTELQHLAIGEGLHLLRPNVVLREFYSSKYDMPSIPLGARFEFVPVSPEARDRGNRELLFNFMGSVKVDSEADRVHLRDVIESTQWTVPMRVHMFDDLVRNPNASTVDDYRDTLLRSSFTLAPVGTADDCFRFWEAIEAGSIPIYVRRMGNVGKKQMCPDAFEDVLAANPPIVLLNDWDELPEFAVGVTEAQVESLRRQMVVWAEEWWTKTARVVTDALTRALETRERIAQALSPQEVQRRTAEVSTALTALKRQQQLAQQAAAGSEAEQREQKQKEAAARREKRSKQASTDHNIVQQLAASGHMTDQQITAAVARLKTQTAQYDGGSVDATLTQLRHALGAAQKAATAEQLENPTFELVHRVAVQVLQATEYMQGYFAHVEYEGESTYMRYPINRANFFNKLVKAVAQDLHLPPIFANSKNIVDQTQPERTRLFLCLLVQAAMSGHGARSRSLTSLAS